MKPWCSPRRIGSEHITFYLERSISNSLQQLRSLTYWTEWSVLLRCFIWVVLWHPVDGTASHSWFTTWLLTCLWPDPTDYRVRAYDVTRGWSRHLRLLPDEPARRRHAPRHPPMMYWRDQLLPMVGCGVTCSGNPWRSGRICFADVMRASFCDFWACNVITWKVFWKRRWINNDRLVCDYVTVMSIWVILITFLLIFFVWIPVFVVFRHEYIATDLLILSYGVVPIFVRFMNLSLFLDRWISTSSSTGTGRAGTTWRELFPFPVIRLNTR